MDELINRSKPYVVAVLIQLILAGYIILSKASIDKNFSSYVFVFYRQAVACVLLLSISLAFRRRSPPLTFAISLKLFIYALFGITWTLNATNIGLKYTSTSMVSAASNSIPVLTFFLALLLRMETMKLNTLSGIGKAVGIALCLAGVVLMCIYRGSTVVPLNLHGHFSPKASSQKHDSSPTSTATWIKGSFFVLSASLTWALWLVLQGKILEEYPSKLLFTTFQSVFSTAQCLAVAVAFEREKSKWELHLDISLAAILYGGFMITGLSFYLHSWCVEKKGPVFASLFTPLCLIFTVICSRIFIGEIIYLGSVIGALLMIGGLYGFLWGKSKERRAATPCEVFIGAAVVDRNPQEMDTS